MMISHPELVYDYAITPLEFLLNPLNIKTFMSMFIHAGILHTLSNMIFLYLVSDNIEADG